MQRFGRAADNEIIVSLPQRDTHEGSLDAGRTAIIKTLQENYTANAAANTGKFDLDNATSENLSPNL